MVLIYNEWKKTSGGVMGDGRYYTNEQFYYVSFLTVLIIFMLTNLVIGYFKEKQHKGRKEVILPSVFIFICIILRLHEEVVVDEYYGSILRSVQLFFLMLSLSTLIYNILYYIKALSIGVNKFLLKMFKALAVILVILSLGESIILRKMIVHSYAFNHFRYAISYKITISVMALFFIFIGLHLYIGFNLNKTTVKAALNRYIAVYSVSALGLLLGIYGYKLGIGVQNVKFIELIIYSFIGISLCLFVESLISYNVFISILPSIKDIILDYVFVIDNNGEIVYKNNLALDKRLFKSTTKMTIQDIGDVFNGKVDFKSQYKKKYLILNIDGKIKQFSFITKELVNEKKRLGWIITFSDISKLICMLDALKDEQMSSEDVNNELIHYSSIVYRLEKEREVGVLLEEIAQTQESALIKLKGDIEYILKVENNERYDEIIDDMILTCKGNLKDVRRIVSTYKAYYGGRND